MPEGSQFNVDCFVTGGDNVNGNKLWLQGNYNGQQGAVTDYYIDTHWNTTQDLVNQGIEECGSQPAASPAPEQPTPEQQAPQQKSCYFNMKWLKTDLTFSYEGDHRYYGNAWQAAKNWTDLDAGISIKPVEEIWQKPDIIFRDVNKPTKWYGKALIPESFDWMKTSTTPPSQPMHPEQIVIEVNQHAIEEYPDPELRLDDRGRTYTLTHEIGHVLGLAHPDKPSDEIGCGIDRNSIESIMEAGSSTERVKDKPFNTPQEHDKVAIQNLYK